MDTQAAAGLQTEAVLKGYDREGIRGEVYPAVFPSSSHSQVEGVVYYDISSADLARLDNFEGDYYFRKNEQVMTSEMELVPAAVYVLKEEYYPVISQRNWDAKHFLKNNLQAFISNHLTFA